MKKVLLLFFLLFSFALHAQTANPALLRVCEENTDGFAEFDLYQANDAVLGDQSSEDYTIDYYYPTQLDAENDLNPFVNPFTNFVPYHQTIYSRVEELSTGNFAVGEVELVVGEAFEVQNPPDMMSPDDDGDAQAQFDLTTTIPLILGDLDPAGYTFYFYDELEDFENRENEIENPESYTNQHNPTEIYVLVENTAGCTAMAQFMISTTLGVPALGKTAFSMYPNPTRGKLFIDFQEPIKISITIADLTGKTIKQSRPEHALKRVRLDLSTFSPGVYFLSILSKSKKITRKIQVE